MDQHGAVDQQPGAADVAAATPTPAPAPAPPGLLRAATLAAGVGLAFLVARDGSPAWQVARVAAVGGLTALAIAQMTRRRTVGRGVVALLVGLVAVPVAAGFAPFLVKEGPGAPGLAALVTGVAGVVLLVGGVASVTQGRGALRTLAAAAATVVLVGAVTLVVSPAVAATNVPTAELGRTPEEVGVDAAAVRLHTPDGVRLAGWYVPSRNGAAVVLLHGAGETRSSGLAHAQVLARHGYGVLLVDARGHGSSGGRAMDFGWHGDADVAAATAFLEERDDVDPGRIGVVGLSMGGEEAIGASGTNPAVRAVVAEGARARTAGDEAWLSEQFGWRGWVQERLEVAQDALTAALSGADTPRPLRESVRRSDARYLLVAAGSVPDEGSAARWVASAAPGRVAVWEVPGSGHTGGLRTDPASWERRVTSFLDESL